MHLVTMGTWPVTSEIVESVEELDSESKIDENVENHYMLKHGQKYSVVEDDINRLFEAIGIRTSGRGVGLSQAVEDNLKKKSMKRPIRVGSFQGSRIGISESGSLKQALRGLCISQASEMAAMKRLSKPSGLSGVSKAGAIKRLYRAVVVEANESAHPLNEGKEKLVEIFLFPERSTSNLSEKIPESQHGSNQSANSSTLLAHASTGKAKMTTTLPQAENIPLPADVGSKISNAELGQSGKQKSTHSSFANHGIKKVPVVDEIVPASLEALIESVGKYKKQKFRLHSASSVSSSNAGSNVIKSASTSARLIKPVFRNKNFVKKNINQDLTSVTSSSNQFNRGVDNDLGPSTSKTVCYTPDHALKNVFKTVSKEMEKASLASSSSNVCIEVNLSSVDSSASRLGFTPSCSNGPKTVVTKPNERSRSREKGELSQSSKSSIGEYSSSINFREESDLSGSGHSGSRPHMSKNSRWEAIHCVQKQHGTLDRRHFKLLRKIGSGDIGTVYLTELTGTKCLFALKVMDNEFLALCKKMSRVQIEREILQLLDHPFLPTLYVHLTIDKFSYLVMDYCPGGDLHVLRQKQPGKSFPEQAARFYVAEVLLALEYLHMLGVVYRDLKPENILIREDGHIMLSDFDLSLRCEANLTLLKSSSLVVEPLEKVSSSCLESSCIDPFCLQPSWQVPCFTPRLLSAAAKNRKVKADLAAQVMPQLVVEPMSARSNSFVGTHEYLAPEIIKGEGHGSQVDWWTFGIFLYELLYGKTPFEGTGYEDTLSNVVSQCLKFPESPVVSSHAKDLIRRLLKKEPESRLGSVKGAAEIKQHPFFLGLNWALIRCATPPEIPKTGDFGSVAPDTSSQNNDNSTECEKDF